MNMVTYSVYRYSLTRLFHNCDWRVRNRNNTIIQATMGTLFMVSERRQSFPSSNYLGPSEPLSVCAKVIMSDVIEIHH